MYYFDLSFLANFFSFDLIWKFIKWFFPIVKGQPLKTFEGNQVFILGSNKFYGCPNILSLNNSPLITVESLGKKLYLSANFYNKDGLILMKIVRNKVKLNQNNIFEIQRWDKNKLKIVNNYNEPIEITAYKTGEIELNGIFYVGNNRIEATPRGTKIN